MSGTYEFLDEDLSADHKRLAAICEGMRRIKGEFYWMCSAGVDSVNQKMLLLMGHCRCQEIYFGVESASIPGLAPDWENCMAAGRFSMRCVGPKRPD